MCFLSQNVSPDLKKVIELDPSNDQCRRWIRRLEPIAAEKREKMKEEMIGQHCSSSLCLYLYVSDQKGLIYLARERERERE